MASLSVIFIAFIALISLSTANAIASPSEDESIFSFIPGIPSFITNKLPKADVANDAKPDSPKSGYDFDKMLNTIPFVPDAQKLLTDQIKFVKDSIVIPSGIKKSIEIISANFFPIFSELTSQIDSKTYTKIGQTFSSAVDAVLEKPTIIDGRVSCDTMKQTTELLEASAAKVIEMADELIKFSQKYPMPFFPAMKAVKYTIGMAIERIEKFRNSKEVGACPEFAARLDKVLETLREVEKKL